MNNNKSIIPRLKLQLLALIGAFFLSPLLISCKKDAEPAPAPTITSFAPSSGLPGATITIVGINFSSTLASNAVKLNNVAAIVTSATPTQLTITVPANATSGKITVTSNGLAATSQSDFIVVQPPTIASFTPTSAEVGAIVTIIGTNFDSTPTSNVVKFNNTVATVTAATTTQLSVTVPANATTGKITVTINGLTAISTADFTTLLPVPTITNFAPLGAVPGSSLVITGTNFRNVLNENTVKVNGMSYTVTASTSTQLTVTIPPDAITGKITVEINGLTATSVTNFEVLKDIPRNGLIAIYPFTGNGNCTNNSTLNFNFSQAGAPALVNDRHNRPSQAISFDGTSQYSEIMKEVMPGQPWTVSFWMDPGNLTLFDHAIISAVGNNVGYDIHLRRNDATSAYYIYTSHVGAALTYLSPTTSYLPAADAGNIWISIILTFDGTTYKVYKDGVEVISNPITPIVPLVAGPRFRIGGDEAKPFIGKLDDIIIYNRVLNTTEITQLFQQTVSKY